MPQTSVADAFRTSRIKAGLSIAELSERSTVTVETIYRIEAGKHQPRMATARRVAAAVGVDVSDLLLPKDHAAAS